MQQCNFFSIRKIFNEGNLIHSYAFLFVFFLAISACNHPKQNKNIAIPTAQKSVQPEVYLVEKTVTGLLTASQSKTYTNYFSSTQKETSTSIKSGNPDVQLAGYNYTMPNFNMDNGLPLNTILSSYCDPKGFLWLGTDGAGACYFDGTNFKTLGTDNTKSGKHVLCFFTDKQGNLFMGYNGSGFDIYNGYQFKSYGINQRLDDLIINGIYQDDNNVIWICGNHGVYTFQNNQCIKIYYDSLKYISSSTFINNDIWLGIEGGLLKKVNQNEVEDFYFEHEITSLTKTKNNQLIAIDHSGRIWQYNYLNTSIKSTLITDSSKIFQLKYRIKLQANNMLNFSMVANDGSIWLGSHNDGAYVIRENVVQHFTTKNGLAQNKITSITQDSLYNIWLCTYGGGIQCINEKSLYVYTTSEGLSNPEITAISNGSLHHLWLGTKNGLMDYSNNGFLQNISTNPIDTVVDERNSFVTYTDLNGLAGNQVRDLMFTNGNLWVASLTGGLTKLTISDYGSMCVTPFRAINAEAWNNLRIIFVDHKKQYWVGTQGQGLFKFNPDKKQLDKHQKSVPYEQYLFPGDKINQVVFSITEDSQGNIWMGTQKSGLVKFNGNFIDSVTNLNLADKLNTAANLPVPQKCFMAYGTAQGLGNACVFKIVNDSANTIWCATNGGGLSRFDGHSFLNYNTNNGLIDNMVFDAVLHKTGHLIIGTNKGLSAIKGFVKNADAADSLLKFLPLQNTLSNQLLSNCYTPIIENFNKQTGYAIADIANGSMFTNEQGIVYAGSGSNSLIQFNYPPTNKSILPLSVSITDLKINNDLIPWSRIFKGNKSFNNEKTLFANAPLTTHEKETFEKIIFDSLTAFSFLPIGLQLPFQLNNITLYYAAVAPSITSQIKYRYRLNNWQNNWLISTEGNAVTYNNLSEGYYTFLVSAWQANNTWSEPATFSFTVKPPLYRTWWAYLIYFLSAALLLAFFIRQRISKIKLKADFEKQIATVEMKALRSQMNPHFIFNGMQAINNYILTNDAQKSSDYLTRFSKLMRMILENSLHQSVPIDDDMAALKIYLQLEQMRLNNSFQYQINIDKNINTEIATIPPLLLQPFVENAILHGIPKLTDGLILITIQKMNDHLVCCIEDNGSGIIGEAKNEKRKSLAIKITKERLNIIDINKNVITSLNLNNLVDENGNIKGLKVEIILPYEEAF